MAISIKKSQATAAVVLAAVLAATGLLAPRQADEIIPARRGNLVLVDRMRAGRAEVEKEFRGQGRMPTHAVERVGRLRKERREFVHKGKRYIEERTYDPSRNIVLVNGDTLDLSLKSITYRQENVGGNP